MKQGGFKKYKKYFLITATAAVLILSLMPTHSADACILSTSPITNCIQQGMAYVLFLIFSIVGNIIAFLVKLLDTVIRIQIYPPGGVAVIDSSWKIMRNFANMFFIVALIMMAFATIFDVVPGLSKYNARALFGKFIFTALLINFSLILGVLVIQGSQVLSNTFLTSIGDISGRLGNTLNPSNLLPRTNSSVFQNSFDIESGVSGALIQIVFSLVLMMTFLFSLLTAFIFTFIRIPILWALLIVSPIAWILNVFPSGQGTFGKWWKVFIGWNMFLPIFLFFLYFGLYFLQSQDTIMNAIAAQVKNQKLGEGVPFAFQELFFYVLAGIFLIGGTMTAMKASMFSGTGVVGVAKWSRGIAAKRLGLTGARQAYDEKVGQIKGGEGRLGRIFGGPPPGRGASRRLLGVRGGNIKTQQDFVDKVGKEYGNIETQYRLGQVTVQDIERRAKSGSATNPEVYAYRKMLAKIGQLDATTAKKTFDELKDNPLAMEDFAKTASGAKWSALGAPAVRDIANGTGGFEGLRGPNGTAVRREAVRHIQGDKFTLVNQNFDLAEFKEYIKLMGGPTTSDSKELIKSVSKYRPDLAYTLGTDPEYAASLNPRSLSKQDMFQNTVNSADLETLAFMPKTLWQDPDFQ